MIKAMCLVLLQMFLFPLGCSANKTDAIGEKAIQTIIKYYFSDKAKVDFEDQPYFISGDFNGDGIDDIAILFYPHNDIKISKQVKTSHPWSFTNNGNEGRYHKSLAILHGGGGNWESKKTQVFALLDKSGVLETPSFKLIVKKHTDKDFAKRQAELPLKSSCDLIILPTEAGIDTFVYWDNTSYILYVPEEIP